MTHARQDDPRVAFGKALRKFRTAKGISQEKLADLAEIHRTYIGDVERGTRNIALVDMTRIADALDVPLSTIISQMEKD